MANYREYMLEGASPVELVVALYDGMIRFLYAAAEAADRRDELGRRVAVKRALDIILHLQARLRMDIGGGPARALSEFYAATFAQILQASQSASRPKFEHAIACIQNVRDAWKEVAMEQSGNRSADSSLSTDSQRARQSAAPIQMGTEPAAVRWTA